MLTLLLSNEIQVTDCQICDGSIIEGLAAKSRSRVRQSVWTKYVPTQIKSSLIDSLPLVSAASAL